VNYDDVGKYRLMWTELVYEPGELKVVAWKDGRKIGEETVRTAGAPTSLCLTTEPLLSQEGEDLLWVRVGVADARGFAHQLATNRVLFRLERPGEIVSVGNGDPSGMKSFKETTAHDLFQGAAIAAMRRTGRGRLVLTVASDGLTSAKTELP